MVLADGGAVEYDWLVLALGSRTATFGIPGVRELALPFCTFDDAQRVRPCVFQGTSCAASFVWPRGWIGIVKPHAATCGRLIRLL